MNPFLDDRGSLKSGTEADLKRLFRRLAKRLHPDANRLPGANDDFLALAHCFEEAKALLRKGNSPGQSLPAEASPESASAHPRTYDRKAAIQAFVDLVNSGFPVDPRVRRASRIYRERLDSFDASLSALGGAYEGLVQRLEAELYALRGDDIVLNRPFGLVRQYFYTMVSFHYMGTKHLERTARLCHADLAESRDLAKYQALTLFRDWLLLEAEEGPALA